MVEIHLGDNSKPCYVGTLERWADFKGSQKMLKINDFKFSFILKTYKLTRCNGLLKLGRIAPISASSSL